MGGSQKGMAVNQTSIHIESVHNVHHHAPPMWTTVSCWMQSILNEKEAYTTHGMSDGTRLARLIEAVTGQTPPTISPPGNIKPLIDFMAGLGLNVPTDDATLD